MSRFYMINQPSKLIGNIWAKVDRTYHFDIGEVFEVVETSDRHFFKVKNGSEIEVTYQHPNGMSSKIDKSIFKRNSLMLQHLILINNNNMLDSLSELLDSGDITDVTEEVKLQNLRQEKLNKLLS